MTGKPMSDDLPRELAYRTSDGLEVSLLWRRRDNRVSVSVYDSKTGEGFELPVEDHKPLEVFHHPYAYAAFRNGGAWA